MKETSSADEMAAKFVGVVKSHIVRNQHPTAGQLSYLAVGEKCGIKNLGNVLGRKGIKLHTVCKVIHALKEINGTPEFSAQINKELASAL